MSAQNVCVILFCAIIISGSVYMNFIFQKKIEKEKRTKEEKQEKETKG